MIESVKRVNLAGVPEASLEDYFKLNAARSRIQKVYHQLWLDNRLDAIVLPSASTTATPLDEWGPVTYTALWNFLDYPAVVVPTGRVLVEDAADGIENARYGEQDQKNYQLCKCSSTLILSSANSFPDTGPSDFANASLSIQVVGMKQEDEQLLQTASAIDRVLNK